MRLSHALLPLLLACSLALHSCGPRERGHASPEAAAELAQITAILPEISIEEILELPEPEEIHALLSEFSISADASLASRPSGITMLHLACLFKKPELARCLLIDKADPNARTASGDTPLSMAVSLRGAEDTLVNDDVLIQLLDILVQGGANLELNATDDGPLLNYAGLNGYSEKVFLRLLELNSPYDETSCQAPAMMGWNTALKRMLELGAGKSPAALETMLLMAAANLHVDTVEILLDAGADVNAHQISGTTPLLEAAGHLLSPAEEKEDEHFLRIIKVCALLIKRGADPYLSEMRQDGSPAFCAADILTKSAATVNALKAEGVDIAPRKIEFKAGIELLEAIGKATVLEQMPEAGAFDAIAGVFSPSDEMKQHPQYHEILPMAVEMLHSIDPQRTSRILAALPIWLGENDWNQGHGEFLLPAITKCEQIILPKQIICATAEHLAKAHKVDDAAYMIELLHRCPDAQGDIEQYCNHSSLPIKAGALAAKLRQAGLPTPRNGDVQLWLDNNNKVADSTPEIQKALLLTSLSKLWYGDMLPEEQHEMLTAMEQIGARQAAAHYKAIAQAMDDPEQLDQLTKDSDTWKYELEIATAEYILSHADAFLSTGSKNTD